MSFLDQLNALNQAKLAEIQKVDISVKLPGNGEERRKAIYDGAEFVINRGHAFRDHATGPATNPRFSGPDKNIEDAIMADVLRRRAAGPLPAVVKVADPGTGVKVHGTPIRYNVVQVPANPQYALRFVISDYMVWQGDPGALTY